MSDPCIDVAIIGIGPAGATLANLLGQLNVSVVVIEREAEIYPLPRAIHFDGEVMRVFETAGLRQAIETISRPGLKGMHFNNAAGETLLIRAGTSLLGPAVPTTITSINQNSKPCCDRDCAALTMCRC